MKSSKALLPADATAVFWINASGNIVVYSNQTAVVMGATVSPNKWVYFQKRLDYANQKWWLWRNGELVVRGFPFYATNLTAYQESRICESATNAASYVDDFQVLLQSAPVASSTVIMIQ